MQATDPGHDSLSPITVDTYGHGQVEMLQPTNKLLLNMLQLHVQTLRHFWCSTHAIAALSLMCSVAGRMTFRLTNGSQDQSLMLT